MRILHLALGGCLKAPPTSFGITADTGGHIAYVLDAAMAQARLPAVEGVTVVTRLFEDPGLPHEHGLAHEPVAPGVTIERIATADRRYLEKEALAADLPAFTDAFCAHLAAAPALPDVIHAHFSDAAAVAMAARRRFGIPFVYTPHALGIDKRASGSADAALDARIEAERAAIAAADAIIVSTADEAERQVRGYGVAGAAARTHRLPPGVPAQAVRGGGGATIADRLGDWLDRPGRPILLAIARPVAKKNLIALARAYRASRALQQRANLVIVAGQDSGRFSAEERGVLDALRTVAADPALAGKVALPPTHAPADVPALYARAAKGGVFVNPALHEPFGLTLIEAAAAGVPVVATRSGGPSEIVPAIGHGLLVDPRDDGAIAEACLSILSDPDRHARLAAAARTGVARYDWARYAADSAALYATLAAPQLLACDIDNTLTGCPDGARAFAGWRQATTMPFVVATGRSFPAASAILKQWRLPEPDAWIVDVGTRIMLKDAGGGWAECADYARRLDAAWDREAVADALAGLDVESQPEATAGPHKLSFFGSADDAARIRARLAEAGLGARVVHSHGRLIDVLAPAGGKAAAIAAYAGTRGWTLAQCIAAGDSGNDEDMLSACGRAIAVGNASDEIAHLPPRPGFVRVAGHHATGVVEGLRLFGLGPA